MAKIRIRNWRKEDIPKLVECYQKVYQQQPHLAKPTNDQRLFKFNLKNFPEGQTLAEIDGHIVGYSCSIIVQLEEDSDHYTYNEITGEGSFSTHTPSGDTLYGADVAVLPEYRGRGIAGMFYQHRKKLLKRYNLARMIAHGRIPGYKSHAGILSPEEYVKKVIAGELKDSALNAHLKAGYKVKKILLDQWGDDQSLDYATWLELLNPTYSAIKRKIAAAPIKRPIRRARVCAAQFEMRPIKSWKDFENNARFFIEVASQYNSHFLVFPELFTVQLFSTFDSNLDDCEAIKKLTTYTKNFTQFFREQAQKHNIYIIAGSHPTREGQEIYNTAYLFTPSGQIHTQEKLHITPNERNDFQISPGRGIKVFDTPFAKIAIVVCYDLEFPELSRLLVNHGAEILIVPFSTDERKAYNRIRFSAHARAVENYAYVVIAGNVGNLQNVRSYLINYAQSAVITPSDFGFPNGSIEGEADPNTETVVMADLDLTNLITARETGTVRPFFDKRNDLYSLTAKIPIEVIKCD